MSSFDKWLNRVTSVSQLLLVVIAAITIKLTVIPLYQKELNSEELAKAQIKLNLVQAEMDSLNKAVLSKEEMLADTLSRLQGAERAELETRTALGKLNEEFSSKSKSLAVLKSQNAKIMIESANLKDRVMLDNQLRFKQALEWFSMISNSSRDCYYPGI